MNGPLPIDCLLQGFASKLCLALPLPQVIVPCVPVERAAALRRATPHASPIAWTLASACCWEPRRAVQLCVGLVFCKVKGMEGAGVVSGGVFWGVKAEEAGGLVWEV
eukprot:364943-Chlamydomonas_euryale.AAC.19